MTAGSAGTTFDAAPIPPPGGRRPLGRGLRGGLLGRGLRGAGGFLGRGLRRLLDPVAAADPVVLALVLVLFAYYCLTPGIFQGKASGDGLLGFLYLPGIFFHHSVDLATVGPEWAPIFGREKTGHVANPCPIGPTFLWWPTYLVGLGIKKIGLLLLAHPRGVPTWLLSWLQGAFPTRRMDAGLPFDYWMTGLSPFALGSLGLFLLLRLLRRHLPLFAARFAVVCAALGTPLAWYMVTQPLYQHATSFFVVTLLCERWDAYRAPVALRRDLLRFTALGAIGGLAMMVRLQEAIWLLLPGGTVLFGLWRSRRDPRAALQHFLRGVVLCVACAVCFLPQLAVWRYDYGVLRAAQAPGHMRWTSPAVVEALFSIRAGLFPWMPLSYLFLPGLLLCRRRLPGLAVPLLLIFALTFYVNASAWDYHASWAFGPRRFTDAVVVVAAGLGAALTALSDPSRWRRLARPVFVGAAVLLVLWNLTLMELLRRRRIKSAAVGAFPGPVWVRWAGGPAWLATALDRWGYPFVQPAAWIYGWIYRMPAPRFEGIVGNYMLERDWRIRSFILTPGISFAEEQSYAVAGVPKAPPGGWKAGTQVPVAREVRLILPFSASEGVRARLVGDFGGHEADVRIRWNDVSLPPQPQRGAVEVLVPEALVHTRGRLNELRYQLPDKTRLQRLDFTSFTEWWKR